MALGYTRGGVRAAKYVWCTLHALISIAAKNTLKSYTFMRVYVTLAK